MGAETPLSLPRASSPQSLQSWMFCLPFQEEIVLRSFPKLSVPVGYSQSWGRFQNRVTLVGNISRNDGSIMLQGVKEPDGGNYTCSIHLGSLTFRKTIMLHVIPKEPLST